MNKIVRSITERMDWRSRKQQSFDILVWTKRRGRDFCRISIPSVSIRLFLQRLKKRHPGSVPSPPSAIDVHGIKSHRGERATRFQISVSENGEIVTIERGEVIVMIATFVSPNN